MATMQIKSLDHIHIYSLRPEAAVEFWQRHFGAEQVMETKNNLHQAVLIVRVGGQHLAFSEFPPELRPAEPPRVTAAAGQTGTGPGGSGVMHLGINVADVHAAVAELAAAGVPVHSQPVLAYGTTSAYVEAPDGVLIELTQY
jgi:catechol 2,3-dioxygenase-like lactoylglutathione lyase family enzyme